MPEDSPTAALAHVLAPAAIGALRLPHRIVMGAMHLGLERRDDGGAALAAFYAERARGGAGLMVTGGAAVSRVGAGGPHYALMTEPADRDRLARVTAEVHDAGGLLAVQLFHAGRYASPEAFGLQPVAPSAVYSRFSRCEPAALGTDGIAATLDDFEQAARHSRALGFDAIEIMASEGYLIDQFLSPLTNHRHDGWGGDAERRARFGVEVLRRVRAGAGAAVPVIVRLSGADLMDGGASPEDVAVFVAALAAAGVDALNVGVGWHESPVPTVQAVVPPGQWVPVAARVKAVVGPSVPVIASNRVNRLDMAEEILATTGVDLVSMARPFLADPELMSRGRRGRRVNICIACNQACIDRSLADEAVSCLVNPRAGHETEIALRPGPPVAPGPPADPGRDLAPGPPAAPGHGGGATGASGRGGGAKGGRRRVLVAGGGPAGLQAAYRLAGAGHHVELYEAAGALGGQFRLACRVPGKQDYAATVGYLAGELDALGVRVHLGRPLGAGDIDLVRSFDAMVVSSGVRPRRVDIEGAGLAHVIAYTDAFEPGALGDRVVIIGGGGIAVDLAHLASHTADAGGPRRRFERLWGLEAGDVDGAGGAAGDDGAAGGAGGLAAAGGSPGLGEAPPGRSVTILQRSRRTGAAIGRSTRWAVLAELRRQGVQILPEVTYRRIEAGGVRIVDAEGTERLVGADTVVVAAGQDHDDTVPALARAAGIWHRVVGGARDVVGLDAVRAFSEGLAAAEELCRAARAGEIPPPGSATRAWHP